MSAIPLSAGPIAFGIITAILTSLIQSLGLTLQRKSHVKEDMKPPHLRRRPFRRGLWRLGFGIFLASNILGSTVQIATLPLVILAPLQASGLIFNAVLASLVLHEEFTRLSLVGTVLVSVGAGLIAGYGALPERSHNLSDFLEMFKRTPFSVWMSVQLEMVVLILIISRVMLISIRNRSKMMDSPSGTGISTLALANRIRVLKVIRGCILGCLSGLLSAHCLLLAKMGCELIINSFKSNQFAHWQSWMIVATLLILELAQLYYLNSGLRLCSTTILYPLVFCIYNVMSILDGLIFYQQFSRLSTLQIVCVAVGTAILLAGVLSLSWRLSPEPGPPPSTPLAANPFATAPAFELFSDEGQPEAEEGQSAVRRSRALSQVEVEGLKDLLGDLDSDTSIIDEEPEMYSDTENNDVIVHQV